MTLSGASAAIARMRLRNAFNSITDPEAKRIMAPIYEPLTLHFVKQLLEQEACRHQMPEVEGFCIRDLMKLHAQIDAIVFHDLEANTQTAERAHWYADFLCRFFHLDGPPTLEEPGSVDHPEGKTLSSWGSDGILRSSLSDRELSSLTPEDIDEGLSLFRDDYLNQKPASEEMQARFGIRHESAPKEPCTRCQGTGEVPGWLGVGIMVPCECQRDE